MIHWALRKIKRKHGALWVDLRWLEPFGDATWAVIAKGHGTVADHEIYRSPSLIGALYGAYHISCIHRKRATP